MPPSAVHAVRFKRASDRSLLVYFGEQITLAAHEQVRKLLHLLALEPISGIRNFQPAYCSVLVKFDPLRLEHEELESAITLYLGRLESIKLPGSRHVEIPVCYGGEYGPDLDDVSALQTLTREKAIELHTSTTYLVYFVGFVPGFAYLGDVPAALAISRLPTPRKTVPPGSVGIAGNQTAVYPFATPGGWRLIGRTPLAMFRPDRPDLSLLAIGDRVRFVPISPERFTILENA